MDKNMMKILAFAKWIGANNLIWTGEEDGEWVKDYFPYNVFAKTTEELYEKFNNQYRG